VNFPGNASEQDEAWAVGLTEDQEEVLRAQQAVVKAVCQEVQDDGNPCQDWKDLGAIQELPGLPLDVPQEKVK
jgi:hypothetical protein